MMSYGLKNEPTAVEIYTKYMHSSSHKIKTYRSGLVINERCFWLGAFPDRKVIDPQSTPLYNCLGKKENQKRHPRELCGEGSFDIEQC